MKRKGLIAAILLFFVQTTNALIVSIDGYGDVPAEGMELTVTEVEEDILTGEMRMELQGDLLSAGQLTVSIHRSESNLVDEFCCAGQCTAGNGETDEVLLFENGGLAQWYVHYTPDLGTSVTVTYTFSDNEESCTLIVHYNYGVEAVETPAVNTLRQGVYTPNGTCVQTIPDIPSLPAGMYITPEKKIIKTK
jgi:hypothetical protein